MGSGAYPDTPPVRASGALSLFEAAPPCSSSLMQIESTQTRVYAPLLLPGAAPGPGTGHSHYFTLLCYITTTVPTYFYVWTCYICGRKQGLGRIRCGVSWCCVGGFAVVTFCGVCVVLQAGE